MTMIDKQARFLSVIYEWASSLSNAEFIPTHELVVLSSLIISEDKAIEQEEEVRNAELNVSTMPEEASADNA